MPGRLRDPRLGALPEPATTAPATAGPADDYAGWTLDALRRAAAARAVPGRSTMRRAELVDALRATDPHVAR